MILNQYPLYQTFQNERKVLPFPKIATSESGIRAPLKPSKYSSYLRGNYPNAMNVPELTFQDFFKVIKELINKKCSINDFSPSIIKTNSHLLAFPIVKIFNQSIQQGKFPDILKQAKIVPVYKKGSKTELITFS